MPEKKLAKIRFHYLTKPFYFPERIALKNFVLKQFQKLEKQVESITYIFCTDEYLLKVNQDFLNHDTYTDIITFELSTIHQPLAAELYISVERVKENASIYNQSFLIELHRVIFHGALHLLGYTDKFKAQQHEMRKMEKEWLSLYFVSRERKQPED